MAHVALTNVSPRISYTVTGAQTAFAVPFAFFAFADLKVYNGQTLLTYDVAPADATEYSVAGTAVDDGYSGGTVTLGASVTSTTITIVRDVAIERSTDFPYPSPTLNIQALNTQLDRVTAWMQQLAAKLARVVALADSDTTSGLTLPIPADRAGKYLAFGPDGSTIVSTGTTPPTVTVSTFAETLLDDASAAAMRNTLALGNAAVEDVASGGTGDLLRADGSGAALTGITSTQADYSNATSGLAATTAQAAMDELAARRLVQRVSSISGAVASGSTVMVSDDTIPQNTEGNEFFTLAITPTSATSVLVIDVYLQLATSNTGVNGMIAALFVDATADAVAAAHTSTPSNNAPVSLHLHYEVAAGSTAARTYKVRAGTTTGTTTLNGSATARLLGGVYKSGIIIREFAA